MKEDRSFADKHRVGVEIPKVRKEFSDSARDAAAEARRASRGQRYAASRRAAAVARNTQLHESIKAKGIDPGKLGEELREKTARASEAYDRRWEATRGTPKEFQHKGQGVVAYAAWMQGAKAKGLSDDEARYHFRAYEGSGHPFSG